MAQDLRIDIQESTSQPALYHIARITLCHTVLLP